MENLIFSLSASSEFDDRQKESILVDIFFFRDFVFLILSLLLKIKK